MVGINTAHLQNGIANSGLHQHGNVATRDHLNDHLEDRNAQHILHEGLAGNSLVIALKIFSADQMHNEFQAHFAAHSGLTKDGPNVEQANAANFQQVLQKFRAACLNGGLIDAK